MLYAYLKLDSIFHKKRCSLNMDVLDSKFAGYLVKTENWMSSRILRIQDEFQLVAYAYTVTAHQSSLVYFLICCIGSARIF